VAVINVNIWILYTYIVMLNKVRYMPLFIHSTQYTALCIPHCLYTVHSALLHNTYPSLHSAGTSSLWSEHFDTACLYACNYIQYKEWHSSKLYSRIC